MSNPNHYVCVHGHFYQPPRENPWLGVVEKQDGAAPFHDWNERIFAECYAAGARARIHDSERRIDRLSNNFLNMSFNIGPTLFRWMSEHHPNTTRRIIVADRKSCQRLDGHGNALAQVFNHMIMPLCNERDKHTQIIWGLEEFRYRYSRPSEAIWLAECGVNMATVRTLIDHGIKYIILAPNQAQQVRHFHSGEWQQNKDIPIDTRRPYRIFERTSDGRKLYNRHLDVFFYDGGISLAIAFEKILRNAEKMAEEFDRRFDPHVDYPQLVNAATDGESYGHHEPYGEMCLAFFFENAIKRRGESVTNYAHFLANNPPDWEVELWEGERGEGSAWSCAHGVDRWYRNCGCADGGEDWYNQEWRTPLREAFNNLRAELDKIFISEGEKIFRDVWEARDDYIHVILDPSPENRLCFLKRHAPAAAGDEVLAEKAWVLLEMEHNGMLMYTSCGWYFAEISGVEPTQNMRYALRAIQHAGEFTADDLESRLVSDLECAKSNINELGTGGGVYRKHVRSTVYEIEPIAACYIMMKMYGMDAPPFQYNVEFSHTNDTPVGWLKSFHGRLLITDRRTFKKRRYAFFAAHISDREAGCMVRECRDDVECDRHLAEWNALPPQQLTLRLRSEGMLIRNMPQEQRSKLLHHVLASRLAEVNQTFSETYDDLRPLLAILSENQIQPPEVLRVAAESVLTERFRDICIELANKGKWDENANFRVEALLEEAQLYHLEIDRKPAAEPVAELVLTYMNRLTADLKLSDLQEVTELIDFSSKVGFFFENGGKIENAYWHLLRSKVIPLIHRIHEGELAEGTRERQNADDLIHRVYTLGLALNFSHTHMDNLLSYVAHAEPDEGEA